MTDMREPTYIVTFRGVLTAQTPLTTTTPALKGRPHDGDQPSPMPKMVVTYDDGRATVPYLPGSGIRGRLRRCGVELARRTQPQGLRLADYYYLAIGGVKGAERESKSDFAAAAARRTANPLIGLFGAAAPWMQGRLSVGHAVPQSPVTEQFITGARLDDIGGAGQAIGLLRAEDQAQWIEMASHNAERSRKEASLRRLKAELAAHGRAPGGAQGSASAGAAGERSGLQGQIDALAEEIRGHATRAYASTSVQRPLPGYEFIPQGTVLTQSMTLTHATRLEIGAFVAILRAFALEPVLGGKAAHGNGVIAAQWAVMVRESHNPHALSRSVAAIDPYERLDLDDPFLLASAEEFEAALGTGRFDFTAPPGADSEDK